MRPIFDSTAIRLAFAQCVLALSTLALMAASPPAHADAPASEKATQVYEVRFMQDMIDHHMMAVEMGTDCLSKAVHPELLAMCQQMVTTQQQEISTMQQWLSTWYGISSYQPTMNPGHQARMQKLAMLTGGAYEVEFMRQMIRHHRAAVLRGAQCMDRAEHDALQGLCTGMVQAQTAEILQMEDWLCAWYGLCRPRHRR